MRRRRAAWRALASSAFAALSIGLAGRAVSAQGLPAFAPINPLAQSRSGLSFEAYHTAHPGTWAASFALDYGSMIESGQRQRATVLLDAEVLRVGVSVRRDLSRETFLLGDVTAGGAYAGFLDGFLHGYHGLLGITVPEREARPRNAFAYRVALPGAAVDRSASSAFLGDVRLGIGRRAGRRVQLQSLLAVTLPTSTAPGGYGRGTVSFNLLNTLHTRLGGPWVFDASVSGGVTPVHGALASYQRSAFLAGSSGLRFRFWGRQSLYANVFYHSPYYHDTGLRAMDRRELSLDFGWILATRSGREWRIGMTEDMEPSGPAIDLIFRLGSAR